MWRHPNDMMYIFVLTRIQAAINKCDWCELRVMFGFFACEYPAEAHTLYHRMPPEIQAQLFTYLKRHAH